MAMMKAGDPRLGSIFVEGAQDGDIVLVGYPSDVGCRRNGGRAGAALGPEYFRSYDCIFLDDSYSSLLSSEQKVC